MLGRADDLKSRIAKVAVEGECCAKPQAAHQRKGDAIREANIFVRVLPHPADRFDFVVTRGGQYVNTLRVVQVVNSIRSIAVSSYPSEQRRQLIDHVIAR